MVDQAKRYIRYLDENNERIMIPAPVAGEYLIHFDGRDRARQEALIRKVFFVPAFDLRSAAIQAELEGNERLLKELKKHANLGRQQLRVDSQILAVAIANTADAVISHDPHMAMLAQGRIPVLELPDVPEQMHLPFLGRNSDKREV